MAGGWALDSLYMPLFISALQTSIFDGLSVVSMFKNVVTPRICLNTKYLSKH